MSHDDPGHRPDDPQLPTRRSLRGRPPRSEPPEQPQYEPPQYEPPQYEQPQYGQPPYEPPQYEQPQYEQPLYSQPQSSQPQYEETLQRPRGGPPESGGRGPKRGLLIGGGAAAVVLIALAAFFLLRGGSATASPESATEAMLEAFKANDENGYLEVACAADLKATKDAKAGGEAAPDPADGLTSYSIGKTTTVDATHATVATSITSEGQSTPFEVAVVKEDGEWKVCITETIANVLTRGDLQKQLGDAAAASGLAPDPSLGSDTSGSLDSGNTGVGPKCGGQGDGLTTVTYYIIDVEVGMLNLARDCVYPGSVPDDVSASLKGLQLTPVKYTSGPVFPYKAGSKRVTVTTAEKDGKWWVVKVDIR